MCLQGMKPGSRLWREEDEEIQTGQSKLAYVSSLVGLALGLQFFCSSK